MAVVVLVERHEEMRRLYNTWLREQDHEVLRCPRLAGGEPGQVKCALLADLFCPFLRRADFIVYDPWPGEQLADQEEIEIIQAIRQNHPGGRVLIAGGWQWLPERIRQLMLEDSGILLAPFNPPDLATQVTGLWESRQRC